MPYSIKSFRYIVVSYLDIYRGLDTLWHRGVVVIATAPLHSTKPEPRFCAGSNLARIVSEIRDGEDL